MKKLFWIRIIIVFVAIAAVCFWVSSDAFAYVDIQSIIAVIILSFVIARATASYKEIGSYIKQASETTNFDKKIAKKGVIFFEMFQNLLIALGVLETFVGVIAMMYHLDKTTSDVGRGWATVLAAIFYSVIIIVLITIPFKSALKKRIAENEK